MNTAEWYRVFAEQEAAGSSPTYERLAHAIADDPRLIGRLDRLPAPKRQPNLLLATCRLLGVPLDDARSAIGVIDERWEAIVGLRSTQTNEPARAATFMPVLAALPQPIALLELGASAGLCLYPDRYRIRYDDGEPVGDATSDVAIDVVTEGPVPRVAAPPEIVWRAGLDLNPLDVGNPDDVAWLEACIWPEHTERVTRLRAAANLVAADPPHLVRGDLLDGLDEVLAAAPDVATMVVIHSAVFAYLTRRQRRVVADRLMGLDVVWLSNEAPGVVEGIAPPSGLTVDGTLPFVLARDGGHVLALSHPHGSWLRWVAAPTA